ncbi:hypothetical protein [Streptacidiphilus sp. EB129]|uniref:hypothetical protein n=1 Tax=Streptacidiphilus sp. EB129 TaxID=3156262 RepID=UPI003517D155
MTTQPVEYVNALASPERLTEQGGQPGSEELAAFLAALTDAVEAADPGPAAPGGWEQRERLRTATWVRQVYDHPFGAALFAPPAGALAREAQRVQAAELGFRTDVGRARAHSVRQSCGLRAVAAVAALWAVCADALARTPRPPRERLVEDAWSIVRGTIRPALAPFPPGSGTDAFRARNW